MLTAVLAVIGKLFQILLIVVVVLLIGLAVLPVVYRIRVTKNGEFTAAGTVRWFFGLLHVSFSFKDKKFTWENRILGIPIRKLLDKLRESRKKKKGKKKKEYTGAKKQPTIPSRKVTVDYEWEKGVEPDFFEEGELSGFERAVIHAKEAPGKIRFTFESLCDKLEKIKAGMAAFEEIKPYVLKLLTHLAPKKIKGYLTFGFDDPASTGMLLAVIGAFAGFVPEGLELTPDFTQKVFKCDVKITGRLFIIFTVVNVIKILTNPKIRKLMKR